MNGLLIINKEKDFTSRDVVNKLNKLLGTKKIGHTGTLDPLAEGVLVICIGKYTKLVDYITSYDKEYIAGIKLGIQTDTLDITGIVEEVSDKIISESDLIETLKKFNGEYDQTVPKYSAVKINGRKLYDYARSGDEITLPKRLVNILTLDLVDYSENEFKIKTLVSKGTYIRSLIKDITEDLNTVGTMSSLIRTKQGVFTLNDSYTLKEVEESKYNILKLKDIKLYPIFNLNDEEYFKVRNGAKITINLNNGLYLFLYQNEEVAIYDISENEGKIRVML